MKQQHSSTLQPADVQKRLKEMADKRFLDSNGQNGMAMEQVYQNEKVCDNFSHASNFNSKFYVWAFELLYCIVKSFVFP